MLVLKQTRFNIEITELILTERVFPGNIFSIKSEIWTNLLDQPIGNPQLKPKPFPARVHKCKSRRGDGHNIAEMWQIWLNWPNQNRNCNSLLRRNILLPQDLGREIADSVLGHLSVLSVRFPPKTLNTFKPHLAFRGTWEPGILVERPAR